MYGFGVFDAKARECLASDYFIGAVNDSDLSLKVRERNPKTLDETLFAAQQIEVWLKDASKAKHVAEEETNRRREKRVRGTTSISEDVVDKLMQRFDKSLQALQSRISQLEEAKRDTTSASRPDSNPQMSNNTSYQKAKKFHCYDCGGLGQLLETVRSDQVRL